MSDVRFTVINCSEKLTCPNACCSAQIPENVDHNNKIECPSCKFRAKLDTVKKLASKSSVFNLYCHDNVVTLHSGLLPDAIDAVEFLESNLFDILIEKGVIRTISLSSLRPQL